MLLKCIANSFIFLEKKIIPLKYNIVHAEITVAALDLVLSNSTLQKFIRLILFFK